MSKLGLAGAPPGLPLPSLGTHQAGRKAERTGALGPGPPTPPSLRLRRWGIPRPRRPWTGVERLGLGLGCFAFHDANVLRSVGACGLASGLEAVTPVKNQKQCGSCSLADAQRVCKQTVVNGQLLRSCTGVARLVQALAGQ